MGGFSVVSVPLQRAMLFLGIVSTVGAIDKWFKDRMAGWLFKSAQPVVDALSILCYLGAVLFTILAAPVDEIVFYATSRVPDWYRSDLPQTFIDAFDRWRVYNILRSAFMIAAWLLQSFETWTYIPDGPNRVLHRVFTAATSKLGLAPALSTADRGRGVSSM